MQTVGPDVVAMDYVRSLARPGRPNLNVELLPILDVPMPGEAWSRFDRCYPLALLASQVRQISGLRDELYMWRPVLVVKCQKCNQPLAHVGRCSGGILCNGRVAETTGTRAVVLGLRFQENLGRFPDLRYRWLEGASWWALLDVPGAPPVLPLHCAGHRDEVSISSRAVVAGLAAGKKAVRVSTPARHSGL